MASLSKNREKYLLEKHFRTKNKKDIPSYLSQFGCRDGDTTDEDLAFITQYVTHIDRLILGGSFVTEHGLEYLKKINTVAYLDLRSVPLHDHNLDCILHFKNLKYLYIKFTPVTASGISTMLEAFPELETLIAEISPNDSDLVERWEKQYPTVNFS